MGSLSEELHLALRISCAQVPWRTATWHGIFAFALATEEQVERRDEQGQGRPSVCALLECCRRQFRAKSRSENTILIILCFLVIIFFCSKSFLAL